MWQIIICILTIFVFLGLYWLFQPYFVWRKSSSATKHAGEKLKIKNTNSESSSLEEHLDRKKNTKIALSLVVPSYNE